MSGNTKEDILLTALHLFAQNGYEAVSVSDIAGALGMTKSALYKHYRCKRDLFDSILARMERLDAERAQACALPPGTLAEMEDAYRRASLAQIFAFARAQFSYWTQEAFPAAFRRMLTLEQYRSEEMRRLYQQYLVLGPLDYVADLLGALNVGDARQRAIELYAPMFLYYSIADGADDPSAAAAALNEHLNRLRAAWGTNP